MDLIQSWDTMIGATKTVKEAGKCVKVARRLLTQINGKEEKVWGLKWIEGWKGLRVGHGRGGQSICAENQEWDTEDIQSKVRRSRSHKHGAAFGLEGRLKQQKSQRGQREGFGDRKFNFNGEIETMKFEYHQAVRRKFALFICLLFCSQLLVHNPK